MNKKIIDKVIYILKEKYKKIDKYLPEELFESNILEIISNYDENSGLNPELYLYIGLENRILQNLCLIAANENIDVEIELMDMFYNKINLILNKMNLSYSEKEKEDILLTSIKTYNGVKLFSLHMLEIIKRKSLNVSLEKKPDKRVIDNHSSCEIQNSKNSNNDMYQLLDDKISQFIIDEKLIKKETFVEFIFNKFNLIELINDNDEIFSKFVYLKYGYYNNTYFSINDIAIILNIKVSDAKKYYAKSLNLLKDFISRKIDDTLKYKMKEKYLKNNC